MQASLMSPRISYPIPFKFCQNPNTVSLRLTTPAIASIRMMVLPSARAVPLNRVDVLLESLPFIQRFYHKMVVVEYGAAAMKSPQIHEFLMKDLVLLSCVGLRMVLLVHGGRLEYNSCLERTGVEQKFTDGSRVTNDETVDFEKMMLKAMVHKPLITLITLANATSVRVSDFNPALQHRIIVNGNIPVIDPLPTDQSDQAYNMDTRVGDIAAKMGAEKLILLTDVAGILEDTSDPNSIIKKIDISGIKKKVEEGKVAKGMIPKVDCCVTALTQGVRTTSIIDGRIPHSILLELLTDEGAGTTIQN